MSINPRTHPMASDPMVGDNFRFGYRFQRHWDMAMASAFFFGELGGGLALVSLAVDSLPGLMLGLIAAGVIKPAFHLAHMGVPGRSWRAILRPDRSWISRGLIAIMVLVGAGSGYAFTLMGGLALPFGTALKWLAMAAALVVMTYHGFSMSQSTAIGLWSTAMTPALSYLYALTGGVGVVCILPGAEMITLPGITLPAALQVILAVTSLMVLGFIYAAHRGSPGARLSAQLLTKTHYARPFWGGVIAVGLVVPILLLWIGVGEVMHTAAVGAVLAGFFMFRALVFKAGVYEPVLPFTPPV